MNFMAPLAVQFFAGFLPALKGAEIFLSFEYVLNSAFIDSAIWVNVIRACGSTT